MVCVVSGVLLCASELILRPIHHLSTTETTMTAHLVHDGGGGADLIRVACEEVREHFGIGHATFQVETAKLAKPARCDRRTSSDRACRVA